MWWFTPVIPALGRLRQEDIEFQASLDCIARLCLKQQQKQKMKTQPRDARGRG
jgi:hypothetical protein